jgi:hypothetical protein
MRLVFISIFSIPVIAVFAAPRARAADAVNNVGSANGGDPVRRAILDAAAAAEAELVAKYGEAERTRIHRGLKQVLDAWRTGDGGAEELRQLAWREFAPTGPALDGVFTRFEETLEQLDGHFVEIHRALDRRTALDLGPVTQVDRDFAAFDPGAHLREDLFASKIAMTALLNFPRTTLAERLAVAEQWARRQWAESRLTARFAYRVPADVSVHMRKAFSAAGLYIDEYNIHMDRLVHDGARPFPKGMRLISHWNLRDELKADYATKDGIIRQRMIEKVMQRIIDQSLPLRVINNPNLDWDPFSNSVSPTGDDAREPDTRYQMLLDIFHSVRAADPYYGDEPTAIARGFDVGREIPEARFLAMIDQLLRSPLVPRVAQLIEKRLGRPLEPFDIWYDGFRPRSKYQPAQLDALTRKRYPTAQAYHDDIPRLLRKLGFAPERAKFFASHIVVDAARGAGHALGAGRRGDDPHLRTRIEPGGMNYKGFNIAVHEMGHNVEQVASLYLIDHTLLAGVPGTAFTEALAFVFQTRDLELLGLGQPDAETNRLLALDQFWQTVEIAGVALVDLKVWHWMYAHPNATPAELRAATVEIAKKIWNEYYAPVFKTRDVTLLAIYSHMVSMELYLPDYPLGHFIAAQIEEHMQTHGPLGAEFERMASFGNVAPDLWMRHATGEPVSPAALLRMTERALDGK